MSTVVANSVGLSQRFKFEKSTLKVSLLWKFNGHTFGEYMEFNDRCKSGIRSTEQISFQSGFLPSTNHHIQCYITQEDYNMYLKVYLEETELPPEYTSYELFTPRVTRKLDYSDQKKNDEENVEIEDSEDNNYEKGVLITDEMKEQLIARRYFTDEDFVAEKNSTIYWFFWDGSDKIVPGEDIYDRYNRRTTRGPDRTIANSFKKYNGDTIVLDIEFDYCFWNKNKKFVLVSVLGEEDESTTINAAGKNEVAILTKGFLFSPTFSDFSIQCRTKSFPAHRMILASKSVAFAAMLEQPLRYVEEGVLKIDDFEPEVVGEFLRFIYTENADLDKYAVELFKMSHKYEIADLKKICESALIAQVNGSNMIEINELAKSCDSHKLKDKCYSVFKLKKLTLLKTVADVDKFKDFMLRLSLE